MKKKKASALARKLEAEKELSAKKLKSDSSSATEGLGETTEAKVNDDKPDEPAADQKTPLSPVPENAEVNAMKEIPPLDNSTSKPIVFGTSSTLTAIPTSFGFPVTMPMQSEPDCPKPSFFGGKAPSFGSPAALSVGGASLSTSNLAFGEPAKNSPEGSDAKEGTAHGSSNSFLNLTPPGKSGGMPGKFVFGKSANITLAVPSGTSMTAALALASLGKAGLNTPFGGAFGGASQPSFGVSSFGGGVAALPFNSASVAEEEQTKETTLSGSQDEEGEISDGEVIAGSAEASQDAAADEA